jgi:hypothetical protein
MGRRDATRCDTTPITELEDGEARQLQSTTVNDNGARRSRTATRLANTWSRDKATPHQTRRDRMELVASKKSIMLVFRRARRQKEVVHFGP